MNDKTIVDFVMMKNNTVCPVCGWQLTFRPWDGESASDEICPCCGIQFGYDDYAAGDPDQRCLVYSEWRENWRMHGMKWWSQSRKPSANWNAAEQMGKLKGSEGKVL